MIYTEEFLVKVVGEGRSWVDRFMVRKYDLLFVLRIGGQIQDLKKNHGGTARRCQHQDQPNQSLKRTES